MDPMLLDAYTHTTYEVDAGARPISFRIGKPSQDLGALLEEHHAREWAYVTAWNPGSRPQAAADNEAAHRRLLERIRERGLPFYGGRGRGDRADWPAEPGVLVVGLPRAEAVRLGIEFGQVAVLGGSRTEAAAIIPCPPYDGTDPEAC